MLNSAKLRVMYRAINERMKQENKSFEEILNSYPKLKDNEKIALLSEYTNEN